MILPQTRRILGWLLPARSKGGCHFRIVRAGQFAERRNPPPGSTAAKALGHARASLPMRMPSQEW